MTSKDTNIARQDQPQEKTRQGKIKDKITVKDEKYKKTRQKKKQYKKTKKKDKNKAFAFLLVYNLYVCLSIISLITTLLIRVRFRIIKVRFRVRDIVRKLT